MKRFFLYLISIIFFLIILLLAALSTIGIETNKFNKLISEKVLEGKNVNLELLTVKFKLDPKELSLFLETTDPKINYKDLSIPVQNIKVYVDFLSLLKKDLIIKKINKAPQTAPVILVNSILSIAVFSVGFGFFNFSVALLASSNVTMQAVEPRLNDHFERNVKCPILLSK